jgi:hypothetical protein
MESMREPTSDTDPAAEAAQVAAVRAAPVWKRIALVNDLIVATRALAMADLRGRYPGASEEELRRRLALRVLSPDEVRRAYGWDPERPEPGP